MSQTERKILEISCLTIYETKFNAQSGANSKISQNALAFVAND